MYSRALRAAPRSAARLFGGRRTQAGVVAVSDPDATTNQKFVRAGATGDDSGDDWENAYTDLPATLVRDTTYWIADGSYAGRTISAAGTATWLRIKKASASLHGIETGWDAAYGDGQADFGQLTIASSKVKLDGSYRSASEGTSPNSWHDSSAYGIIVNQAGQGQNIIVDDFAGRADITLRYLYLPNVVSEAAAVSAGYDRPYCIDCRESPANEMTGFVVQRCFTRYGTNHMYTRGTNGAIIEYCAIGDSWSSSNNPYHGEVCNVYFSVFNEVIRHNYFRDCGGASWQTATIAIASYRSGQNYPTVYIYGNIFQRCSQGDALIGYGGSPGSATDGSNCRIYNNTIVDCGGNTAHVDLSEGSGNVFSNNLRVNGIIGANSLGSGSTDSYNGFSGGTGYGTNAQTGITTNIFVEYANNNFRLQTNTEAGAPLGATYNTDMLGNTRSTWSRGALEYVP